MGVLWMETYIKNHVPGGYVDVSVMEECVNFHKEHNERPILVFDIFGLVNLVASNNLDILCGGRHNKYKEFLESILMNFSLAADLVFFVDGPLLKDKYDTWFDRETKRYQDQINVIDSINAGCPLTEMQSQVGRNTTHLTLVQEMARKFGELKITYNKECDTEIAQFASREKRVLAVMGDDSDFLVYPGTWRYFSMRVLNPVTLLTKEYSRSALRKHLKLNDLRLLALSTLAGNDIMKHDDLKVFNRILFNCKPQCDEKFAKLASYVKRLPNDKNEMILKLATSLVVSVEKVQKSFDFYDTEFQDNLILTADPVIQYCIANSFNFVTSILLKRTKNFTLLYQDLRDDEMQNFHKIITELFRKQIGIILWHERNDEFMYKTTIKRSHHGRYEEVAVPPNYYPGYVPPLIQLFSRDKYPCYDEMRLDMLQWIFGEGVLTNFSLNLIPKRYFLDVLTVTYLCSRKLIKPFEADLILLTVKHVETDTVPEDLKLPRTLHPRAFKVAFLFTKFVSFIAVSLKTCGLSDLLKTMNFDGLLFHVLYWKYRDRALNLEFLLSDLQSHRIYKN